MVQQPLVLRLRDAARLLAVGEEEMRDLCRSGEVKSYRTPGGHFRIPRASLEEYVQRRADEAEADRRGRRP